MKLIVENWRNFLKEGLDSEWADVADQVAQDQTGLPPAGKAEQYIIANWREDPTKLVQVAARNNIRGIDVDFLAAWITGKLESIGGPSVQEMFRKYGDHTEARLYEKFKNVQTKYDKIQKTSQSHPANQSSVAQGVAPDNDRPADGLTPVKKSVYDVHSGGADTPSAPTQVSGQSAISALKQLLDIDYSKGLSPQHADNVMSIIMTAVAALEREQN